MNAITWACIGLLAGVLLLLASYIDRKYLLIHKDKLKNNQAQIPQSIMAPPAIEFTPRCACCKETQRNADGLNFTCPCAWSAEDIVTARFGELTCSYHRRVQRVATTGRTSS